MAKTMTVEVFTFDELDADAKEVVREKYREWEDHAFDADDFRESVLEESAAYYHRVKTDECYFSLSCCQGDGVAFYGDFDLDFFMAAPGEEGAPEDGGELAADRAAIQALVRRLQAAGFSLAVTIEGKNNRYHHYNSMRVEVTADGGPDHEGRYELVEQFLDEQADDAMTAAMRAALAAEQPDDITILVGFDWFQEADIDVSELRLAFVPREEWDKRVTELEKALDAYMTDVSHDIEKRGYAELDYRRSDEVIDDIIADSDDVFDVNGERFVTPTKKRKKVKK